jgi:hypothetical protein
MSSVFTKTVAVDWTGGVSAADVPSLAVIGVLATAGMLLSQASYRGAGLAAPLATLTVVNPVVAAAVGITMFGETFRYGTTGTALALSCGVVAAGGLILLTTERLASAQPETAGARPEETRTVPTGVAAPVADLVAVFPKPADNGVAQRLFIASPERPVGSAAAEVSPEVPSTVPDRVPVPSPVAQEETKEPVVPVPAPVPLPLYGPFYGGPYISTPVLDRRRVRIKS